MRVCSFNEDKASTHVNLPAYTGAVRNFRASFVVAAGTPTVREQYNGEERLRLATLSPRWRTVRTLSRFRS
jgi:hypothetical protein